MTTAPMTATDDALTPRKEHRFTFGLWTVGNPGRDPFGDPVRPPLDPVDSVHRLAELGAWGVNFHDDDLVPYGSSAAERDSIVASFKQALEAGSVFLTGGTGADRARRGRAGRSTKQSYVSILTNPTSRVLLRP